MHGICIVIFTREKSRALEIHAAAAEEAGAQRTLDATLESGGKRVLMR